MLVIMFGQLTNRYSLKCI
ncbi:hypothetical protein [Paludibacter propionicigenes]